MFIVSIASGVINDTYDFQFAVYCISSIIIFFAAYFCSNILSDKEQYPIHAVCAVLKIFVGVVSLQSLLALLMFLFPSLSDFLNSLITIPESEQGSFEANFGLRLYGFGVYFFASGVIHGLAFLSIIYLYLNNEIKKTIIWVFIYVFNFAVGFLISRTSIVGFLISVFFLFYWRPLSLYRTKIKWMLSLAFIFIFVVSCIINIINDEMLMWAFDIFSGLSDSGTTESASLNRMWEMYEFPTNCSTYFIGDGLYNLDSGYYKAIDIGFLRLLYYGGIPMVVSYYYYSFYIIRRTILLGVTRLTEVFLYIVFLYLLALNFKGLADINPFLLLLYLIIYNVKQIPVKKISQHEISK